MGHDVEVERFVEQWRETGGSELANTQSFINALCNLIGVEPPHGSRADDGYNDYVFERRVFQDNGDGTVSFGRIDAYKRGSFILEAKQGSDADRVAAERGDDDLDLFGQTATTRMKRGTARRGTPRWAKAMVQAKGQAERYAKALPIDHGWPPFLLVADIGYCIEVYADFTGTGKAYAQFPDRSRYRIMLEDLRDEDVRRRLAAIWTKPASLDPSTQAARVTREIADLLATVSRRLEGRGHSPDVVSGFLSRILFTMFAEDTGVLLPQDSFKTLLRGQLDHPEHVHHQLSALWEAMDKGVFSPALGIPVKRFNGYLFKNTAALPLEKVELEVLIEASLKDWTEVEPAIFGTLLERALNVKERAKLGAHYTPRAYVERLVGPTIIDPLRADWAGVRVAATELIDQDRPDEARKTVEAFHGKLAGTRVLDPACGTGNFLYVAMARMKELEGEVLDLLVDLGDNQYLAELTGHTITPENFLGIEINPRAAAIAQLVLWIGYLQWHFRVNGKDRAPPEPILRDIRTIENRDALIDWDARELERDETGAPMSRWDGETMKQHAVTGKLIPDDAARVEVYRYVNPRAAKWPNADFIVGNPPFIGVRRMRQHLGDGYVEAIRKSYPKLPADIDFVTYWWKRGADAVAQGNTLRSGLVTTNSLAQLAGRDVIREVLTGKGRVSVVFVVADHPWRDSQTDAAVRITMTVLAQGRQAGQALRVANSDGAPILDRRYGLIQADLSIGVALDSAKPMKSNNNIGFMGVKLAGDGFRVDIKSRDALIAQGVPAQLLPRLLAGADVTRRTKVRFVIDAFGMSESELRDRAPAAYQHLLSYVYPTRKAAAMRSTTADALEYARNWWLFAKGRPNMRIALKSLERCIVTSEVSKHPTFIFTETDKMQFDGSLIVIAHDDPLYLGFLSSKPHTIWKLASGGTLEDRPRYQLSNCFDRFPFPAEVTTPVKNRIRAEAEALDALRKQVLAEHEDLTLTALYNVLDALRAADAGGPPLTLKERDVHARGLVTLIRQHHDAIDGLVAEAYGWSDDYVAGRLTDSVVLERLVTLNKERAAEEARGLIRYLRPEFQDPGYRAPSSGEFDLDEAAAAVPDNVILWPTTLPEQVGAVQQVLVAAAVPLTAQDIARCFKGKRVATVRPVLDALAGLGMARRLTDGRYAA